LSQNKEIYNPSIYIIIGDKKPEPDGLSQHPHSQFIMLRTHNN